MIKASTLSAQITLAMAGVIAACTILLGIISYAIFDHVEHRLLEILDSHAFRGIHTSEPYDFRFDANTLPIEEGMVAKFTASDSVPVVFLELGPGYHHNVRFGGRTYHVAVKETQGVKKYMLFDITEIETQENIFNLTLLLATLGIILIVVWVVYLLSRKVFEPVQQLSEQVGGLDPDERNVRIAKNYHGVEVGLIASSFDRYMERLDNFVEREQSFTSIVSHELRTPLSVISTSVELLEANKDHHNDTTRQYIEKIKKSTSEMVNLISALLFLAREDPAQSYNPPENTDLTELASDVVDEHKYLVRDQDVELSVHADQHIQVHAPRSHVQIVIANLLDNAIRHTEKGPIQVRLKDNKLSVVDSGTGIDPSVAEHAFERGFHARNTGHGFGLYICKRICERYGWSISLSQNPDVGSTATVSFT